MHRRPPANRTGYSQVERWEERSTTMRVRNICQLLLTLGFLAVAVIGEDPTTSTPKTEVSPDAISDLETADTNALIKALEETGGPGGTLEKIDKNVPGGLPGYRDHSDCSNWEYDNTAVFPNGRFRHEFAVLHTENDPPEVRYAGFLGDRYAPKPYVVTYLGGYDNEYLTKPEDSCQLLPWGVLQCDNCVMTHFIFHDQPQVGCKDVPQELGPTILSNGDILEDKVGVPEKAVDPEKGKEELAGLNVDRLLLHFGGAPGLVTKNRFKPLNNKGNPDSRENWVYDYRFTNASSAIRFEHALLRSAGPTEQHEEIFGSLYWRSRSGGIFVNYHKNSSGLHAESDWATIRIYRSFWMMETPPNRFCKLLARPGVVADLLNQSK